MSEFKETEKKIKSKAYEITKNDNFIENDKSKSFERLQVSHSSKRDANRIVEFRNRNSTYVER